MEAVFAKYRKAKRTIESLNEQIKATEEEIRYLETLEEQIAMAGTGGLREIIEELGLVKAKQDSKKKPRPQYLVYKDGAGNMIMVGKNNLQNNYLTHRVARKNDYFFHVKGAREVTILRAQEPTNEAITRRDDRGLSLEKTVIPPTSPSTTRSLSTLKEDSGSQKRCSYLQQSQNRLRDARLEIHQNSVTSL